MDILTILILIYLYLLNFLFYIFMCFISFYMFIFTPFHERERFTPFHNRERFIIIILIIDIFNTFVLFVFFVFLTFEISTNMFPGIFIGFDICNLKLFTFKNRFSIVPSLQNLYFIQFLTIFMSKKCHFRKNVENQF